MEPQSQSCPVSIRRRWLRRSFKAFAFIAALYVIEWSIGEWMWRSYQKEAAAKGVKLRVEDYEAPPIPDEENYAAAPIFKRLLENPGSIKPFRKQISLPDVSFYKRQPSDLGQASLGNWQHAFVKKRWIPSKGPEPAVDILKALERLEGTLSEVRAASARPKARWSIKPAPDSFEFMPLSGVLRECCMALSVRARALLALDRPDEALAELRHIVRACESLEQYPGLFAGLNRNALCNLMLEAVEQGMQEGKWQTRHLTEISSDIRKLNRFSDIKFCLDSDRVYWNLYLDRLVAASPRELGRQLTGFYGGNKILGVVFSMSPRGWIRRNQIQLNRLYDIDSAEIDLASETVNSQFSRSESLSREHSSSVVVPLYHHLAHPAFQASFRFIEGHNHARQVEILCALVSYREAHGALPESLEQLVPAYLNHVPHDIMDGKPMRYRRNEDGGCVIWSIGKNRVDDGGVPKNTLKSRKDRLDWAVELPSLTKP